MFILLTSTAAVAPGGTVRADVAQILIKARANGIPVGIVSNNAEPAWFAPNFAGSNVQFLRVRGRQSGKIISENATKLSLQSYDCLVLAANAEDVQMGKNGHAVLIAAGWSADDKVRTLGIAASSPHELAEVLDLMTGWSGKWWYSGDGPLYSVRALADLSQYHKPVTQQQFAAKLTTTVKNGGSRLNALLAVGSRSLLVEGVANKEALLFGVYPSSDSTNDDTETLSDYTHRVRTTVSRVKFAQPGQPLFIRHCGSPKRSAGGGGDRLDPSSQIQSTHINPFYRTGNRLSGKNVIVIDDCTTYGVSFGVSAALLRAAGVASMTGVALGKFGRTLHHFDISVTGDPFGPLGPADWKLKSMATFGGTENSAAQGSLQKLIP